MTMYSSFVTLTTRRCLDDDVFVIRDVENRKEYL